MAIIGSSTTGVTLNPAEQNVTLTGDISGFAGGVPVVFTFTTGGTFVLDFFTAVDAPGPTAFDITNDANIDLARTGNPYQAMLLGAPGIVINNATIIGGAGIDMRGTSSGAYIRNNGFIGVTPGGYDGPGIDIQGSGGVANAGSILGGNGGVYMLNGGLLDNSGQISARHAVYGNGLTLNNTGRIIGFGAYADGAYLSGLINNAASGTIAATPTITGNTGTAIKLFGENTLNNSGLVIGADGVYSDFTATSTIQNNAGGTIAGTLADGIDIRQPGTVENAGLITAAHTAIHLDNTGFISNTGTIEVQTFPNATTATGPAISIAGGGAIFDSALIAAPTTAIAFAAGFENLLALTPTATIAGAVNLYGILALGAGAAEGKADLTQFENLEGIIIAPDAAWHLHGALPAAAGIFNGGTLTGAAANAAIAGGHAIYNYGLISAPRTAISSSADYLYNAGQILAATTGISLTAPGYVINTGKISAATAIQLAADSQLYNYAGAKITGGVSATTNAYVYNYARATITAPTTALSLTSGIAYNAGFLSAANGIILSTGTVTNFGTIEATAYAVDFLTNAAKNRLILSPMARTAGTINLNGGVLDLASAPRKTGTLATLPANLSAITVESTANWDISAATLPALTNNGTLFDHSALTLTAPLTGNGTLVLDSALTLKSAAPTQKIAFSKAPETLYLTTPTAFAATIENFAPHDTVALPGVSLASITHETLSKNILTLAESATTLTLTFASLPTHDTFSLITDAQGTAIILSAPTAATFIAQAGPTAAPPTPAAYTAPSTARVSPTPTPSGFLPLTQPPTPSLLSTITLQS